MPEHVVVLPGDHNFAGPFLAGDRQHQFPDRHLLRDRAKGHSRLLREEG